MLGKFLLLRMMKQMDSLNDEDLCDLKLSLGIVSRLRSAGHLTLVRE
jgi:hypothetical protein